MLAFWDVIWLGSFFSALVVLTQRIQEARHRRELHASEYMPHARHVQICRPHAHTHRMHMPHDTVCPRLETWHLLQCRKNGRRNNAEGWEQHRQQLEQIHIKTHTESIFPESTFPATVGAAAARPRARARARTARARATARAATARAGAGDGWGGGGEGDGEGDGGGERLVVVSASNPLGGA